MEGSEIFNTANSDLDKNKSKQKKRSAKRLKKDQGDDMDKVQNDKPKTKQNREKKSKDTEKTRKKGKSIWRKQQSKECKKFFESGSDRNSWAKMNSLKNKYLEVTQDTGNDQDKQNIKSKLWTEITSEYEKLINKLNQLDEQIAQHNLEKAIWIETLKVLQSIPSENLAPNEEVIQNKKLKELNKELENLYIETDSPPQSIWEYSINNKIMSSSAQQLYSSSLLKNLMSEIPKEDNLLKVKKLQQTSIKSMLVSKKEIIEISDVESTGPGVSIEHISDSSQDDNGYNKNVTIHYS